MKKGFLLFTILLMPFFVLAQITEDYTDKMLGENRESGHQEIRQYYRQLRRGGPENEEERNRIVAELYKQGKLYKSQDPNARKAALLPPPPPVDAEYNFANGLIKGKYQLNYVTNEITANTGYGGGVRLDRTVYDAQTNTIYALNTIGNLYHGPLQNKGELQMINQTVQISDYGFTGVQTAKGFRLIAGINPVSWTSGAFFYSDDNGYTWNEAANSEFTTSQVYGTESNEKGEIFIYIGRIINGVVSRCVLISKDKGESYQMLMSWPDTESNRAVLHKIYHSDDICLLKNYRTQAKWDVYKYGNEKMNLWQTFATDKILASVSGTFFDNKYHIYIGVTGEGGYLFDGTTFKFIETLVSNVHTVDPNNPNLIISNMAQHNYSNDGGLTWKLYPNQNTTIGWDPKHLLFYKGKDGKYFFLFANDMGIGYIPKDIDPLNYNAIETINAKHTYAILHGGKTDDATGLTITGNQDPGTFELTKTGDNSYLAKIRQGADGLRIEIANKGKSFWYRHYWNNFYHNLAENNGTATKATISVVSTREWYTPPFKTSWSNEDAIYVSGYSRLFKLTYTSSNNRITRTDLPYNFLVSAGDSTIGVATCKNNPNRIYVATRNKKFFISNDAGQTWVESPYSGTKPSFNTSLGNQGGGYIIETMDNNADVVFWGGGTGASCLLVSFDGGKSFKTCTNGFPTTEALKNIAVAANGELVFSNNFQVYVTAEDKWYSMKTASIPAGISANAVDYLPKQKKVRYYTWGAGMFDFNLNSIYEIMSTDNTSPEMIDVYPNPATDYINIKFGPEIKKHETVDVEIYDLTGRSLLVKENVLTKGNGQTVDIRSFEANQRYFLKVILDKKQIVTKPFIVIKK